MNNNNNNNNNILLLTESAENIFESPSEDLLRYFSEANNFSDEFDENNISHQNYIRLQSMHSRFLPLRSSAVPASVFVTDSATSSLDVAHSLIRDNIFPAFSSVLCRSQTSGRGQLRRNWSSPEGNIYAALCLPNIPPFSTEAAAPALGGIIVHALNSMGYEVYLKWPNDILQKNPDNTWRKVGGILLEERQDTLIAGIGINIASAPDKSDLRSDYLTEAGVLQANRFAVDASKVNACLATFLHEKAHIYQDDSKNLNNAPVLEADKINENINNLGILTNDFTKTWGLWLTLVEQIFLWYIKQVSNVNDTSWQSITQQYLAFTGETMRVYNPIIKESSYKRDADTDYIVGRVSGINSNGELLLQTAVGLVTILGGTFSQEANE